MEEIIINAVIKIGSFITAIGIISGVISKVFTMKLKPINITMTRLDENHCKDFLVGFLAAVERGEEIDEVEIKRAHEVYDHYTNDLHKNSYIHDKWEKLMK